LTYKGGDQEMRVSSISHLYPLNLCFFTLFFFFFFLIDLGKRLQEWIRKEEELGNPNNDKGAGSLTVDLD
jgi:hypothetical protein